MQVSFGLNLCERKRDRTWVAVESERIDPGTTWIAEAKELRDFVIGFACGVVESAPNEGVVPGVFERTDEIEVGVPAGDDKCEGRLIGEG